MNTACISLGSNVGERERYLHQAVERLHGTNGVRVQACSKIYETDPVGYTEQPPFLNMVVKVGTTLSAAALFRQMKRIESDLGRERVIRWGPRTIDLDLLLFGKQQIETPDLTVPHPRMNERLFVLIPLLEVLDDEYDGTREAFSLKMALLHGKDGVKPWRETDWPNGFELFES